MKIESTTAVITGATGGLGSDIAMALAHDGCDCVCHYNTNQKAAEQLVARIQQTGKKAISIQADLTSPDQIQKLFQIPADFAPLRILINSAATFTRQPLDQISPELARHVFDTNLTAPILTSQHFARIIKQKKQPIAKIINIADIGGIRPWANYTLYCASKAGLISVTKSLAKELAPEIYVNAIAPGLVTWPENFTEQQKENQLKRIPAARIANPKDITEAIIFLLNNNYITGQTLNIDGGRCI